MVKTKSDCENEGSCEKKFVGCENSQLCENFYFFYIHKIKIKGKRRAKGYSAVAKFHNHRVLRNFTTTGCCEIS